MSKKVTRYFLREEDMERFHSKLCEKHKVVICGKVLYGETIIATWHVGD